MAEKLYYEDRFHRLLVNIDGVDKSIINPIAFYHLALMEYSPKMDIETIVLFEKMVVFYRANRLKPFEYQQERLMTELHIKRTRLEKARAFLIRTGILVELNPGKGKKIRYSIDKEKVVASIPILYLMPDDEIHQKVAIRELQIFFEYFLNRKYLRTKRNPSTPDYIHTGMYSIMGPDKRDGFTDKQNDEDGTTHSQEEQ